MPFLKWGGIENEDIDLSQFLQTETKLDKYIVGFGMSHLVIVTGTKQSGKTSLTGNLICNFANKGHKGLLCSFEMKNARTKNWVRMQALGADNLNAKMLSCGKEVYYPKSEFVKEEVDKWLENHLQVYDNSSFKLEDVSRDIKAILVNDKSIRYVILDNLMKLDNGTLNEKNEWAAQEELVKRLQVFAQKNNICIILVVHPTKVRALMRLNDIKGSGAISDAADTVIIVHRTTADFKIAAKDYFGWKADSTELSYDTLFEIAKDREFGMEGQFCGMYFCKKGKRFLNDKNEKTKFGWQKSGIQIGMTTEPVDDDELPF